MHLDWLGASANCHGRVCCCAVGLLALMGMGTMARADRPEHRHGVATQPTKALRDWQRLRFAMFIHFGLSTFTGHEFGRIEAGSEVYAPTGLDVEQWIRTAKAAGMRYAGTQWATDDAVRTAWLEVDLGTPRVIARATISEFLDSIRQFELQVSDGAGNWRVVHRGQRIGGTGVEISFDAVEASKIRLVITNATLGPTIWDFAVYAPRPARPE